MQIKRKILRFIRFFRPLYVPFCNGIRKHFSSTGMFFCSCKFIRRLSNPNFRNYISQYRNPSESAVIQTHPIINMPVHVLGPLNRGKVVMLLENQSQYGGFCAIWIYFLNRLTFSDKMGFYHVINWNQSEYYQEKHPVNGATSIYEYYFQQPSGISLKEAKQSCCVVYDWNNPEYGFNDVFHVGGDKDYQFTAKDIAKFAKIQKKYIRLHPDLAEKISNEIKQLLQGKKNVLGVHARGADTKVGYKNHPTAITAEDYLERTDKIAKQMKADLIFLATDDQQMLEQFIDKFGEKLIYYKDVVRSNGTVMNCYVENERKNHHYMLGIEIIRDVYSLAACQGFVCNMSYVSMMVQILKKANNEKFKVFSRIFRGINENGVDVTNPNERAKVRQKWNRELKCDTNHES